MAQKRKDGLFQYQLYLGKDEDGKRITKVFYGKSKKAARDKAEEWKRQKRDYEGSLRSVADKWLQTEPDTTKQYRLSVLLDALGNRPIAEINAVDIEKVLQSIARDNPRYEKPTSQRTLTRYLHTLNNVFTYAQKNRLISFNPCPFVTLPKCMPPKKRNALTREEIGKIEEIDHKAVLPAMIMVYCGLRRGEVTALTWADVDLQKKTINVNKSYSHKINAVKGTKTVAGIRIVPIPEKLLNALISASKGKKKTDYVVSNDEGGHMTEASWTNFLDGLKDRVGFKFSWHQLRHTYATILYSAGVDVLTAQYLLGHADAKTTMSIYTHLAEDKKQSSIDKLNAYIT